MRERYREAEKSGDYLAISSVVLFELRYGVENSGRVKENTERLRVLLSGDLNLLDFDDEDAQTAGRIRAAPEKIGTPIGAYDLLMSGTTRPTSRPSGIILVQPGHRPELAGLDDLNHTRPRCADQLLRSATAVREQGERSGAVGGGRDLVGSSVNIPPTRMPVGLVPAGRGPLCVTCPHALDSRPGLGRVTGPHLLHHGHVRVEPILGHAMPVQGIDSDELLIGGAGRRRRPPRRPHRTGRSPTRLHFLAGHPGQHSAPGARLADGWPLPVALSIPISG